KTHNYFVQNEGENVSSDTASHLTTVVDNLKNRSMSTTKELKLARKLCSRVLVVCSALVSVYCMWDRYDSAVRVLSYKDLLYKMSQSANDEFSQHLSDDEESNHENASDTGAAPKQQQQVIPQTTAISNIKLPILKKEEYDIWAMEMEHYLEYIDNEVWKVIQNGNSKKRILTRKDGIIRILPPVTAAEIQAIEKERKAKNILLMAIPKEHMRRFHGMDDAKEI
ncbi:hypothetical protein Tco_1127473, partial [Tanacetum coccineum]